LEDPVYIKIPDKELEIEASVSRDIQQEMIISVTTAKRLGIVNETSTLMTGDR
jgi:hypothetical protein